MRPEQIPELAVYPNVQAFVQHHLAMQFGDVRAMLRLPLPHEAITNGCNFAAAAILTNLVSAVSVVLYNSPAATAPAAGQGRAQRFRELLTHFYPWTPTETPQIPQKIEVLWGTVRNPFAHSGAVLQPGR